MLYPPELRGHTPLFSENGNLVYPQGYCQPVCQLFTAPLFRQGHAIAGIGSIKSAGHIFQKFSHTHQIFFG